MEQWYTPLLFFMHIAETNLEIKQENRIFVD